MGHARDHFYGSVPCTRALQEAEVADRYEWTTGKVIVETFRKRNIDPMAVPAVLVCKHGPFTWGASPSAAVENALVLDETAHLALLSGLLSDKPLQPARISAGLSIITVNMAAMQFRTANEQLRFRERKR